jgi:hypothetical protein
MQGSVKTTEGHSVKKLKGRTLYAALWLSGILALVLASGAPNRM